MDLAEKFRMLAKVAHQFFRELCRPPFALVRSIGPHHQVEVFLISKVFEMVEISLVEGELGETRLS